MPDHVISSVSRSEPSVLMGGGRQMPDIRLQDYTAKIKDLMQVDRLDEAIAHGQHILRHYPKHVETYCLLGEACLEKGMFREAIEFFQRTLGADPESLMARVGLGVIYDEQGALLEAIWQMERAFELAPGNTEVRQELLRLFAQRDGVEKSRLKLTRGALGRLCSRNGLYERAINEFRAVLRQDPELPDVRVAFAEALWREGRRLEAVDICQSLLDDLPFCLKANLILCEIWQRSGHEDAGEERLELARALDPEGLVAQEMMGKESPLPVEEVLIPELEVTPDLLETAAIPAGVGMPIPASEEESVEEIEWTVGEEVAEPWDMGEEMPDWLQEIAITEEEEPVPQPEDEEPSEEVAVEAQVPDWLQEIAIAEEEEPVPQPEDEEPSEEVAVEAQVPDWLQELAEEEEAPVTGAAEEKTPAPDEIPDWLREIEMEDLEEEIPSAAEVPEEESTAAAEIPEWLAEVEMPEEEEEAIGPPTAEVAEKAPEPPSESEAPEKVPLPEAEEPVEDAPVSVEEPEPASPEPEIPGSLLALVTAGILSQADLESALEEMSPEELEAQQAESVPDWLQDLIGEETPPVAAGLIAGRPSEEVPEGVHEFEEAEEEELPPPVAEEAEEEGEPAAETRVEEIELVEEVEPAAKVEPVAEAQVEEFAPDEELPDWLRELGIAAAVEEAIPPTVAEEPVEEEAAPPPVAEEPAEEMPAEEAEPVVEAEVEEFAPEEELPDWLRDLGVPGAEGEVAPPTIAEEPVEEEAAPPTVAEEPVEEEAAPPTVTEEPVEEMPTEEVEPAAKAPVEEFAPDEELPDWLRESGMPAAGEEFAPEEELPDWLRELGMPAAEEEGAPPPAVEEPLEELPVEEAEPVAEAPVEEFAPEEELPDWLRDLGTPGAEEQVAPPPAVEEPVEEVEPAAEVPVSLQALVEAGILDESDVGMAMAEMSPEDLEAQRAEAVPNWLQALIGAEFAIAEAEEVEEEIEPLAEVAAEEAAPIEERPDRLREPEAPAAEEEVVAPPAVEERMEEIEPVAEVPESLRALVEAGILDESDLEAAMAEMLPKDVEAQRAETVPDWLQDLIGAEAAPVEEATPPPVPETLAEETPSFEEEVLPVAEVTVEETLVVEEEIAPPPVEEPAEETLVAEEEIAPPPVEEPAEETLVAEEEIAPPPVEELVEAEPPVEAVVEPPQAPLDKVRVAEELEPTEEEAPAEEAPPVEEVAPPTELEMVAPYERVEIEEEAAPPARLQELLTRLKAKPRDHAARLELARLYSAERDWNTALDHYEKLIAARNNLPTVIDDLTSLTQKEVDQARVYQMLGDAHMQSENLDQALEMYRLARQALANR
jgi:tetratricopeptide (TPR) repeat protein